MDGLTGVSSALPLPPTSSRSRRQPKATDVDEARHQQRQPVQKPQARFDLDDEGQYGRSAVSDLWLQSRQVSPPGKGKPSFRLHGESRPMTYANFRIACSLIQLVRRRFFSLFWTGHRIRMIAFLAGKLVQGVLPAARIWTMSQLLDEIQLTFERRDVNERQVLWLAFLSVSLVHARDQPADIPGVAVFCWQRHLPIPVSTQYPHCSKSCKPGYGRSLS